MARKRVSKGFVRNVRRRNRGKKSDLERIVEGWLTEKGYEFKAQYAIGRCHVDLFFPPQKLGSKGTVVELNGCHWHGHKKCLKKLTRTQISRRIRDGRRYKFLLNQGYDLVLIWGCDISKNFPMVARKLREVANRGRR